MNRLKLIILSVMATLSLTMSYQTVYALDCSNPQTTADRLKCGTCAANGGTCPDTPSKSLNQTIADIINILSIIGGLAAVIMIIVAGLRYVTSAGNADAAKSARQTILYAVIGLIIISFAQIIVHFVLKNVSTTTTKTTATQTTQTRTGAAPGERPN